MPQPLRKVTPKLIKQFIFSLRRFYRDPQKDPYDVDHLWECFEMYFNFLRLYADPRITEINPLQWRAYEISIKEPESADWRTRRGGKSMAFAVVGPFFCIIEFGIYEGFGIYRAPYSNQLKQFEKWIKKNPFVESVVANKNKINIFFSEGIDYSQISESTTASLGASFALLDEEKKIEKGLKMYDLAMEQRGILIEGDLKKKRIIHKSTGGDLTYWSDIVDFLRGKEDRTGRQCIIKIPWSDCPWITEESINEEKELNYNAPWYVDQEYNCLNVPVGGYFFNQTHLHILGKDHVPLTLFDDHHLFPNKGGVDFNGAIVGHILLLTRRVDYDLFIFDEIRFDDIADLKLYMDHHQEIDFEVEGTVNKGGAYNAGFADHLVTLGARCAYNFWEDNTKQRRLSLLQLCNIYVHPKCRWFIENYKSATFDPKPSVEIRLKKTNDQHGLDACLHSMNEGGNIDIAQTQYKSRNPYEHQPQLEWSEELV